MATYVQRATAIINALTDTSVPADKLQRIADLYIQAYPNYYSPVDPDNPTNEERARPFVEAARAQVRHALKSAAERKARLANEAAAIAAGAAAAADIDGA